jgi:putative PIN family toxin of toxin-antitoxin system
VSPDHGIPIKAVLDTNIWLDLLVFRDPGVAALADALAGGRLEAYVDDFGLSELDRVLAYPLGRIRLDDAARSAALAACKAAAIAFAPPPSTAVAVPLPQCRDPHDQPFLELARACRADWLVTKDRDLLMLARRISLQHGFAILPPQAMAKLLSAATDGAS